MSRVPTRLFYFVAVGLGAAFGLAACVAEVSRECRANADCPSDSVCRIGVCIDESAFGFHDGALADGSAADVRPDTAIRDTEVALQADGSPRDADPNDAHPNDARPDGAHPNDARPDGAHPNDAGSNETGPNDVGPNDTGPNDARTTDVDPSEAGPNDADPNETGPNDAGPNDAGPNDADPNDADPNDADPHDADPNDASPDDAARADAACTPSQEVCNGLDDDCDQLVDETFPTLGQRCTVGDGACLANGVFVCAAEGDVPVVCDAVPGLPEAEICDNRDNDCDRVIDEGLITPCYFGPAGTAGVGQCRFGGFSCVFGQPSACMNEVTPSDEICDGLDNDCDGDIDDGVPPIDCYDGDPSELEHLATACREGVSHCVDGEFGLCVDQVVPAADDPCNDVDDDCDGEIDEDCACDPGEPCVGLDVGACEAGFQVCEGNTLVACIDRVDPAPEVCNGYDDDCDGTTDEDADVECYDDDPETLGVGPCRAGTRACNPETGEPDGECRGAVVPQPERCDGVDDNCDGEIDETFESLSDICSVGIGACRTTGVWVCAEDASALVCSAQPAAPGEERCDAIDNDCDGAIDEDADAPCYPSDPATLDVGACRAGVRHCSAGGFGACQGAIVPGLEVCNGVDDDCDGLTDEDADVPCYEGPANTQGVGSCVAGVRRCVDGALADVCEDQTVPANEICDDDAADENCDGTPNEGCDCVDGEFHDCGPDRGACEPGVQTCRDGAWGPCEGGIGPVPERCDGAEPVDNDCDGHVDEGLGLGASCSVGTGRCAANGVTVCGEGNAEGEVVCAATPLEPIEERCNSVDDDCDGETDEIFPEVGEPCTAGLGACVAQGVIACADDGLGTVCHAQAGNPMPERCNGIDDDCDGDIDESFPALGGPCAIGVGACETQGIGVCTDDGGGVRCEGAPGAPAEEDCNGIDDDCDGAIDETFALLGFACGAGVGACAAEGVFACAPNGRALRCEAPVGTPTDERCNAIDDDCDGATDETYEGLGDACSSGVGACARAGVVLCGDDEDSVECSAVPGEPDDEICNGRDDNCDGATDEAFPVGVACTVGVGDCETTGVFVCEPIGTGVVCDAEPGIPAVERCGNDRDENCDGVIDEGFGLGGPCTVGQGACVREGALACAEGGAEALCDGEPGVPTVELCGTGIDEDCDGMTDEGFTVDAPCRVGVGACVRDGRQVCAPDGSSTICDASPGAPEAELCGDGIDNDCDGLVDDGFDTGATCHSGIGACVASGVRVCSADGLDTICNATPRDPGQERCGTSQDEDCDGEIDEGFDVNDPCEVGVGACRAAGAKICSDDRTTTVCNAVAGAPATERCGSGIDEDCDGTTDEGYPVGEPCVSGVGECRRDGIFICADNGLEVECDAAPGEPEVERCGTGLDEDCDGVVDEGYDTGSACSAGIGACRRDGQTVCRADALGLRCDAVPAEPGDEACGTGEDEDCDGLIDEGFGNVGLGCAAGIGECRRTGEIVCDPTIPTATTCNAVSGQPTDETCNNLDDDCDGQIDETCECRIGEIRSCGDDTGTCESGTQTCVAGAWGSCDNAVGPVDERCGTGLDEDCDGAVDEGFDVDAPCAVGVGECRREGLTVCTEDKTDVVCGVSAGIPDDEACDGLDNDCNGAIDDAFGDLGASCAQGVGACRQEGIRICAADGSATTCDAIPGNPANETCNGVDDDCNDDIDNGTDEICYDGLPTTRTIGACRDGVRRCVAGALGTCEGQVLPAAIEICNGIDDDCDGDVDEDAATVGDPCNSGHPGPCADGALRCVGGTIVCEPGIAPGDLTETCDATDEDCDGLTDEGLTEICYDGDPNQIGEGQCEAGFKTCVDGAFAGECISQVLPSEEACDGVDNDCDGAIDDVDTDIDGNPIACTTGLPGVCEEGVPFCDDSGGTGCDPFVAAGDREEQCDDVDNDCDGNIDENLAIRCYDGPDETAGVGQCREGRSICDAGVWGACDGQVLPTDEICNAEDDDCDGRSDEDSSELLCPVGEFAVSICAEGHCKYACDPEGRRFNIDRDWETGCERGCGPQPTTLTDIDRVAEREPNSMAIEGGGVAVAWMSATARSFGELYVPALELYSEGVYKPESETLSLSGRADAFRWPDVAIADDAVLVAVQRTSRGQISGMLVYVIQGADRIERFDQAAANSGPPAVAAASGSRAIVVFTRPSPENSNTRILARLRIQIDDDGVRTNYGVLRESDHVDVRPAVLGRGDGYLVAAIESGDTSMMSFTLVNADGAVEDRATVELPGGASGQIGLDMDGDLAIATVPNATGSALLAVPIEFSEREIRPGEVWQRAAGGNDRTVVRPIVSLDGTDAAIFFTLSTNRPADDEPQTRVWAEFSEMTARANGTRFLDPVGETIEVVESNIDRPADAFEAQFDNGAGVGMWHRRDEGLNRYRLVAAPLQCR